MMEYLHLVKQTMDHFLNVRMVQLARGQNRHTNSLATLASSLIKEIPQLIKVKLVTEPSINARTSVSQMTTVGPCWMDPVINFLAEDRVLDDKKEAEKVHQTATRYWLFADRKLYGRSFGGPYLQCLHPNKVKEILAKLHDEVCGNHAGGHSLAHRAMIQGF